MCFYQTLTVILLPDALKVLEDSNVKPIFKNQLIKSIAPNKTKLCTFNVIVNFFDLIEKTLKIYESES